MTASWGGFQGMPAGQAQARAFLGLRAATQLAVRTVDYDVVMINLPTVRLFACRQKLPLAMALEYLAAIRGLDVSYRAGRIVVSSPRALAKELAVTRTYAMAYGSGRVNAMAAPGNAPLPQEEDRPLAANVAEFLLAHIPLAPAEKAWGGIHPEKADHLKVLQDLRPDVRVEHDATAGTLTITAAPLAVDGFTRWGQGIIGQPGPAQFDELTRAGRLRRLEHLAAAAWATLDEPARAKLRAARCGSTTSCGRSISGTSCR